MKSFPGKLLVLCLLTLTAVFWLSGCGAKGYIVASVQSVLGLDVSENPKTQVPHVRFGYVRSQYYYIPTGKSESGKGQPVGTGRADETPELVSEMDVDFKFLSSGKIHERFAVGKEAVKTDAATNLFAGEGKPVPTVAWTEEIGPLQKEIFVLMQQPGNRAKAEKWISDSFPNDPNKSDRIKFVNNPPAPQLQTLQNLRDHLKQTN